MPSLRPNPAYSTPSTTPDALRPSFVIPTQGRDYKQQYANLYWLRLAHLRKRVAQNAQQIWKELPGAATPPPLIPRILDVPPQKLVYIIGTIYLSMSLKPNVLEDLAREHYIAAPPPLKKFYSDTDEVMLEDESGRIRLVGEYVQEKMRGTFVTGTILAALGAEQPSGDFEVLEVCYAGLPPQLKPNPNPKAAEGEGEAEKWVAIVSGLEIGKGDDDDGKAELRREMLAEWLLGELELEDESAPSASRITRLILAGNSLAQPPIPLATTTESTKPKRYGYDSSLFSLLPSSTLDLFLSSLLPSLPIDLLAGELDPTGTIMPQQPIHPAILPSASAFCSASSSSGAKEMNLEERFNARTNPFWCDIDGFSFLGTSGQPLDDIFKYLTSTNRLSMASRTLHWSHLAPTCPDTLWSYPHTTHDPFILQQTPHVYYIGNQPRFETSLVKGGEGQVCRVVLVPRFGETGEVVLVRLGGGGEGEGEGGGGGGEMEVRVVKFEVRE